MINKNINSSQAGYSKPRFEFVVMPAKKIFCASGYSLQYGSSQQAGATIGTEDGGSF